MFWLLESSELVPGLSLSNRVSILTYHLDVIDSFPDLIFIFNSIVCIFKSYLKLFMNIVQFSSVQLLSGVSLPTHGLQHASLPCPSPTPRACSNACPSS